MSEAYVNPEDEALRILRERLEGGGRNISTEEATRAQAKYTEVIAERDKLRETRALILETFAKHANEQDWCGEFDAAMIRAGYTKGEVEDARKVETTVTVSMTRTITVPFAPDDIDAYTILDHFASTNKNSITIGDIYEWEVS